MNRIISVRTAQTCLAAAIVFGAACSGTRFAWDGTWRGQRPVPDGNNAIIARTLGRVELTVHDTTFDLFEGGVPKTGKIRFADGKAYLQVQTFMGRPIAEQGSAAVAMNEEIEVEPLGPDAVSYHDPRGFDPAPLRLERVAQPDDAAPRTRSSPSGQETTKQP